MSRSKSSKPEPISDRTYVLTFGKYKGYSIDDVMDTDRQYLAWLHNNNDHFELCPALLEEAEGWRHEDYEPSLSDIFGKP